MLLFLVCFLHHQMLNVLIQGLCLCLQAVFFFAHLLCFKIILVLLLCKKELQLLNLSLLCSDSFNKFFLFLKSSVANQLGMIHLNKLKLFGRCKLLLKEVLALTCMGLLDLGNLPQKVRFRLGSLSTTSLLNLVSQLNDLLSMV